MTTKKTKKLNKSEQEIFDLLMEFVSNSVSDWKATRKRTKVKSITRKVDRKQKTHVIKYFNKKSWVLDTPYIIENGEKAPQFFELVGEEIGNKIVDFFYKEVGSRKSVWCNIGLEMFITFVNEENGTEFGFPTISYLQPFRTPKNKKVTKLFLRQSLSILLNDYASEFESYQERGMGYAEINAVEAEVESGK